MKCNQSRPGFELVSPCPFPTTITTTPRACCDSQSDSICLSPDANPQLWNWQKRPLHHYRAFSMLYGWCDTRGGNSFINSSSHIDPPKEFELWFDNQKEFVLLLCCPVFAHHSPLDSFDIVLLPQQWFQPSVMQAGDSDKIVLCIGKTDCI